MIFTTCISCSLLSFLKLTFTYGAAGTEEGQDDPFDVELIDVVDDDDPAAAQPLEHTYDPRDQPAQ